MKLIKVLLVFCLLLASCGNNEAATKVSSLPKATETKPSELYDSKADFNQRISKIEEILTKLKQINQELQVEVLFDVYNWLNSCSIGIPASNGNNKIIVSKGDCLILVLEDKDSEISDYAKSVIEQNTVAQYDYVNNIVALRPLPNVSTDYITMILVHEAVHHFTGDICKEGDFNCLARNESKAYIGEFIIFDYFAEKNNSRYREILEAGAQKMSVDYEKTGEISLPDYSKSIQIRAFFNSKTEFEDRLWFTVFWLRQYWEMYIFLRGDYDHANISFVAFLETMYSKGVM